MKMGLLIYLKFDKFWEWTMLQLHDEAAIENIRRKELTAKSSKL